MMTTAEADHVLRDLKKRPACIITDIRPDQAEKIKLVWDLLHTYDREYEYTFMENFTKLRKEKRNYKTTKS